MPTTRSQGRHEPLQQYTPPRRQRKLKTRKALLKPQIPQDPPMRTLSMSPEPVSAPVQEPQYIFIPPPQVPYTDASTQTEDVVILTVAEAAELREQAAASISYKRNRDDESDDEPVAKRHQFSTPQNTKPNNLWMFGERVNSEYPRTAPSKSAAASSFRRSARGPLTKRTNLNDSPRNRGRFSNRAVALDSVKPIEHQVEENEETQGREIQQETDNAHVQQQSPQAEPQTPGRGFFGSLRGIVTKGLDIAGSLTPLGRRTQSAPNTQQATSPNGVTYPQLHATAEQDNASSEGNAYRAQQSRAEDYPHQRSQPSSDYDHLHYIPADTESVNKAMNGEIEPPAQPPTPPSPASRIKAQNPKLSDETINSILRKRSRKAALDEERYGPRPTPEASKVAPLFGPDSHYSRGTVDPRFLPPASLYGPSKKRKLQSVNGQVPGPKNGGFGIDDEYLDVDTEIVSVDAPVSDYPDFETPAPKKHKTNDTTKENFQLSSTAPATPRSALKKPGFTGSVGRKSVAFGNSMSRDIRGHYGPAGQYKGSTFADELPDDSRSLSSIDHADVISPTTRLNTVANSGFKPASVLENLGSKIPKIDFTLRDPNDPNWRPSLSNPRPGSFRVPDFDEEDPDESMVDDDTPEQPQTPRMSHAELPAAPSTMESQSFNESSIMHESTELALDKARLKAEKYKPKSSSRLSEVSRARSRSTSPDAEGEDVSAKSTDTRLSTAPPVKPIGTPPQPFVPPELDNEIKGSDGMTDFEREHQYDEWAANLDWDAPQTYEESGTGSAFIHNLIRKNWTDEDSQRSETFWAREFDEVDNAMEAAKAAGQQLVLITGMEELEGY